MEYAVIWFGFGVASAIVAKNKGRSGCLWLLVGLLLGPIGFIISLVMSKDELQSERNAIDKGQAKKCPACAELVKYDAKVCKHCGKEFESVSYFKENNS